jgi:predicted alpha/beta superfamily hydrolase
MAAAGAVIWAAPACWGGGPRGSFAATPDRYEASVTGGTLAGDFRYHRVRSGFLTDDRTLIVFLPPSYKTLPAKRYPVLYLHDGNNVFDASTAFMGREWQLDETAGRLIAARKTSEFMMVGVYNTPARLFEYTWVPRSDGSGSPGGGGGKYGRMLTEEIKPFIDQAYRTKPGRTDTAVMGSSLGGLSSFYLGSRMGDAIGKVGCMSPSIWWAGRAILGEVAAVRQDLQIWLDMGTEEGGDDAAHSENLANARKLRDALVGHGYQLGKNLAYLEDEGGTHDEPTWAKRAHRPLEYFFPPD